MAQHPWAAVRLKSHAGVTWSQTHTLSIHPWKLGSCSAAIKILPVCLLRSALRNHNVWGMTHCLIHSMTASFSVHHLIHWPPGSEHICMTPEYCLLVYVCSFVKMTEISASFNFTSISFRLEHSCQHDCRNLDVLHYEHQWNMLLCPQAWRVLCT